MWSIAGSALHRHFVVEIFDRNKKFLHRFAFIRHEFVLCLYSVAYPPPRRNKSIKNLQEFLV